MSKILKITHEPIAVYFHEGIRGQQVTSEYGAKQWKHYVNGPRDTNIVYLPEAGQQALEECEAQSGDWVEISKQPRGREMYWYASVVNAPEASEEKPAQRAGKTPPAARPAPQPKRIAEKTPQASQAQPLARPEANTIAGALMAAFDALREVAGYAQSKGEQLRFNEGDIRALGISMYIEHCKQRADERRAA